MDKRVEINRGANNAIGQSGIGYIVVPNDVTRLQYIEDCYRTHTVTMNGGFGYGYVANVRIFPSVLQQIHFPLSSEERGAAVFWVRENFSNTPVIIGVIADDQDVNLMQENEDRTVQTVGDNVVEIYKNANNATMVINVIGTTDTPSDLTIKVVSGSKDSVIHVMTDGKVDVDADTIDATAQTKIRVTLATEQNETISAITADADKTEFVDKNGNRITINADNVNIVPANQFNVNDGKEPMVLGNTLVNLLKEILQAIQQISVPTPHGVSGTPINSGTFSGISSRLETMLSKISNLN